MRGEGGREEGRRRGRERKRHGRPGLGGCDQHRSSARGWRLATTGAGAALALVWPWIGIAESKSERVLE